MKKKILAMLLVVTLLGVSVVSGTLAYFTDTAEATNVFTVGDVDITLTEKFDVLDGKGGEPIVGKASYNYDDKGNIIGASYTNIMPSNYIEKKVSVTNNENPAYIRVLVIVNNADKIAATLAKYPNYINEIFDGWDMLSVNDIGREANGMLIDVESHKNGSTAITLEEDEVSYVHYLAMDKGDEYKVFDGLNCLVDFDQTDAAMFKDLKIEVYADAIQQEGFDSADDAFKALEEAHPIGTERGVNDNDPTVFITKTADLVAAIANGGKVALGNDIVLEEGDSLVIEEGTTLELDLNGYTIEGNIVKGEGHVIENNGTLKLIGGTVENKAVNGGSAVKNNGVLTVNGGTYIGAPLNKETGYPSYAINNYGSLEMTGVEVKGYHGAVATVGETVSTLALTAKAGAATTVLNNCNLDAGRGAATGITSHAIYVSGNAKVVINGGTYKNTSTTASSSGGSVIYAEVGTVTINGGTFNQNVSAHLDSGMKLVDVNGLFVAVAADTNDDKVSTLAVDEETLASALAAGKVTLMNDIEVTDNVFTVAKNSEATIDLNGHTLTGVGTASAASKLIEVVGGGELTISNGTISYRATTPDTNWGAGTSNAYPGYANNTIVNRGSLTLENVTIENWTARGGASYAIDCYAGSKLVVGDRTVIAQRGDDVAIRMFNGSAGEANAIDVTINDGARIEGCRAVWIQLASNNAEVAPYMNLTVNGGILKSTREGQAQPVIYSYSYGNSFANTNVTINGGEFLGSYVAFGGGYKGDTEKVTITGGSFEYDVIRYTSEDTVVLLPAEAPEDSAFVADAEAFATVAKQENATVYVAAGNYTDLATPAAGTTIIGTEGTVFNDTLSNKLTDVTFKNVEIKSGNAQRWGYSGGDVVFENCTFTATSVYAIHYDGSAGNITYRNCDITGWVAIGGSANVTFENCRIYGNGTYGVIRTYAPCTIKNCTFDVAAVNTTDVFQDGIHAVNTNVLVLNCTNVNGSIEDLFNVSGTGKIYTSEAATVAVDVAVNDVVEHPVEVID